MKKPHVLNRAMFNRGGTSAYGRGITSNLVTEEQRQRFNYGGRVGYAGLPYPKRSYTDQFVAPLYNRSAFNIPGDNSFTGMRGVGTGYGSLQKEKESQLLAEELEGMKKSEQDIFYDAEREKARFGDSDKYTTGPEGIGLIEKKTVVEEEDEDGTKDVMTDSDWMDLLGPTEKQKKATKGKTQLSAAAGVLEAFSQPTLSKGMQAGSKHLLNIGKTATGDQDARDKAILQGKVLEKVYRARAQEKGAQDMNLAMFAAGLAGDPLSRFRSKLDKNKSQVKALEEVLGGVNIPRLKTKKDGSPNFENVQSKAGDVFATDRGFLVITEEGWDGEYSSAEEIIASLTTPAPGS